MIAIVLTALLGVTAGVLLERRSNALAHRVRHVVARGILAVLPVIAYVSLVRLEISPGVTAGIVTGYAVAVLSGTTMWLLARGPLRLDRPTTGAAMVGAIQSNTAMIGLPLAAALFSQEEFAQAVAFDTLVVLPLFIFGSFTLGAIYGTAGDGRRLRDHLPRTLLATPMIPVVIVALIVPDAWAPTWLQPPVMYLAYALAPLGFLIVGITLADEADEGALRIPPPLTRPVAAVIALQMIAMPAAVALVSLLVIELPAPFLLLAAMPVGLTSIVVAHRTGLDLRFAAGAVAWTNGIALLGVLGVALVLAAG